MTNQTQAEAIESMLIFSNNFSENRRDFYAASEACDNKRQLEALDRALAYAQLSMTNCKDAGFEPREVMACCVRFVETFGAEAYYNLLKASA